MLTGATLIKSITGIYTITRDITLLDPLKMNFFLAAERQLSHQYFRDRSSFCEALAAAFSACVSKRTPAKGVVFTRSNEPISYNMYRTATCTPNLCFNKV